MPQVCNTMNKRSIIALFAILLSCSAWASEPASVPQRIISLAPATTEILFALGLGDRIVGVTSFCDNPAEATSKAKIGGMSNPSLEAIVSLKPDIVVMTTDGNPREVEQRLRSLELRTFVWRARTIKELPGGIRELATALAAAAQGEQLASRIEQTLAKAASALPAAGHGSKALFIVWPEPLVVAGPGTAIHDAMQLLGLVNTAGRAKSSYPRYSIEEMIREEPEVIFIGKGTGMDMQAVSQGILQKLASTPAARSSRVFYVGDHLYRLGPRVPQGIEELAQCMQ